MKNLKKISTLLLIVFIVVLSLPINTSASSVKLNKTKVSLEVGKSTTLKVNGTKKAVKWSSSDKKIATVTKNGKVKGISEGKATITATVGSKTYKATITVKGTNINSLELSEIINELKKDKLLAGDETEMMAELIGAIKGVKYSDNGVEIYEYDLNSEIYKDIVKSNTVIIDGLDLGIKPAAINGKFVLFCSDGKIVEAFTNIK